MRVFEEISRFMIKDHKSRQLVIVSKSDTDSYDNLKKVVGTIVLIGNRYYKIKDVEPQELILKKGGRISLLSCPLPINYERKEK